MTLNAPFKVHTYYIYLLKLSIIPHKLFWPYVIFFLNSKDCFLLYIHNFNTPPQTHTNCGQLFWRKSCECKKSLQMDVQTDRQRKIYGQTVERMHGQTDRQNLSEKPHLKYQLSWAKKELRRCIPMCFTSSFFLNLATNDAGNSCILMKRFCVRGRCCIFSSFLGNNNFEDMQIHGQWS